MNRILFALAAWIAVQCASAQLSVVIDLNGIPDTCRIGVDTLDLGTVAKKLVLVPRSEMEHFDVRGGDTAFMYLANLSGPMMRYRQCYKVQGINSNCPWLSFQRYTPTKCE